MGLAEILGVVRARITLCTKSSMKAIAAKSIPRGRGGVSRVYASMHDSGPARYANRRTPDVLVLDTPAAPADYQYLAIS